MKVARRAQRGYLLISVVVTLFLLACVALLLNQQSAINANAVGGELAATQADYVAEAGLRHAQWLADQNACAGDIDLTNVPFGAYSYSATVSMASGGGGTQTITNFDIAADTYVQQDNSTQNFGTAGQLNVIGNNGADRYALYRFDLSAIPIGTTVSRAVAKVFVIDKPSTSDVHLYRITADWDEDTVTWDSFSHAYDASATQGAIPKDPPTGAFYDVDVTSLVQQWVNGAVSNFGFVLKSQGTNDLSDYSSKEYGNVSQRTYLEVTTTTGQLAVSPATIDVTAHLAGGVSRQVTRSDVPVYNVVSSQVITLKPGAEGKDTFIEGDAGHQDHNKADDQDLKTDSESDKQFRSLLEFDLGQIPRGARVIAAELNLNIDESRGAATVVEAHRITQEWTEGGVTWLSRNGSDSWIVPGGDFDDAVAGSFTASATGPVTLDITELADGWVRGQWPNYGLMLLSEPASGDNEKKYTSSDDTGAPDQHPSLTITYACECGTVCVQPQGSGRIKMVISDFFNPHPDDWYKWALFRSWGYDVDFIDDNADGFFFDVGLTGGDVIYVSATVSASTLGQNINDTWLGVVNEEAALTGAMGFTAASTQPVGQDVSIADNTHFITAVFPDGALEIFDAPMEGATTSGTMAPGADVLATWNGEGAIVTLEKGAQNYLGNPATSRRVQVPLGDVGNINLDYVSHNGWVAVQRAIAWAMGPSAATGARPLLMVVADENNLTDQEDQKIALFETWNHVVTVVDDGAQQDEFDSLIAANDVAYVGEDVAAGTLGTKLREAPIGVVIEEEKITDEFGISTGETTFTESSIDITDDTHYITQPFSLGPIAFVSPAQPVGGRAGTLAPGLTVLAERPSSSTSMLDVLESGVALADTGAAAGRRVKLPWGGNDFDISSLTDDGRTILRRALEWAAEAEPGPIAHWKLDDGAGSIALDSVGSNDGTLVNGPVWGPGALDGGLRFDGVDDRVDIGAFDVTGTGITMAGWFNADVIGTNDPRIVSKANSTAVDGAWWQLSTSNSDSDRFLRMRIKAGGTTTTLGDTTTNLTPGRWYHAAGTYDVASGRMTLYLDGVEIASRSHSAGGPIDTDASVNVEIGANGTAERLMDGVLDDVRVYDRALAADEIANLAERPLPLPIAHWKLDETSGTTAVDSVGGHDGTATNTEWVSGQLDGGLRFNSASDSVTVPHADELSIASSLTVSAWINKTSMSGYDSAIVKATSGSDLNFFLGTWENNPLFGFSTSTDNWQGFYATGVTLNTGQWYHLAATFDNAADLVNVYIDGSLVQSFATTLEPVTNTGNVLLGRSAIGEYWPGILDDVRIYDRALDAAEIAELASPSGGSSFIPASGGSCSGTFRDEFNAASFSGSDGTLNWATDWLEVGESNGATSGDIQVRNDGGDNSLRTRDNDNGGEGVMREADLTGASSATLSYEYRRMNLDNSSDYTSVEISPNGDAGPWTELVRHQGSGNDGSYVAASHNISAYISSNTRIRFLTSSNMGGTDTVWFDNVEIACTP